MVVDAGFGSVVGNAPVVVMDAGFGAVEGGVPVVGDAALGSILLASNVRAGGCVVWGVGVSRVPWPGPHLVVNFM